MDIYEQAKKFDADYYDQQTGYIYQIQAYNRALKFGLLTPGIGVTDFNGNFIGYARKLSEGPAESNADEHPKPLRHITWQLECGVSNDAPNTLLQWLRVHQSFTIDYDGDGHLTLGDGESRVTVEAVPATVYDTTRPYLCFHSKVGGNVVPGGFSVSLIPA